MQVEIIPVLGDNYAYLVICEETGQAAAVDPVDADAVAARAEERGVTLTAIWCTHHHADHTGGNRELVQGRELKVYGHSSDSGRIPAMTDGVEEGASVALGRLEARVLHTPGHTLGAVCYLVQDALFTGDTLFGAGCGRLFEGDPEMMYQSLHRALRPLPPQTRVFFGHEYTVKNLAFALDVEPRNEAVARRLERVRELQRRGEPAVPGTLAEELETNPFLRCDSPGIAETLRDRDPGAGEALSQPQGVFTRLRELRNVY